MRPSPADRPITVLQFGNDPHSVRGGIAAVIRQHLSNTDGRLSVTPVATYDPSGSGLRQRQSPYARALRRALARRTDNAVAHVHISQGGSLLREGSLVLLLRLRRMPVVVTLHGSSSLTSRGLPFLLTGSILRLASVAHFLSDAHRRRYAGLAGRHVTIPNAVPVAPTPAAGKRSEVVFAGVVGTRKGVDVLLDAWRSMAPGEWSLHLYGPADGEFRLPDGVPGVIAHGEVPPETVRDALATASIAVLPSREEAFPMFLLEAMANHCAVVATDVGGVRELLGDAGAVVPPADAGALGAALHRLIAESDVRAELAAAAGRRAAERFDADSIARTWAETYATMAARGQGREGGPAGV